MKKRKRPDLVPEQQHLLGHVTLRLLEPHERVSFDQLLVEKHYLQSATLVGEQLRYVAEYNGRWVALLAWSAAAYNLKDRETWIGWTAKQKARRLPLVANNSRFLLLERSPNLASRVMRLCLERLSRDWQATYRHGVLIVESFVDSQLFRGTCYKASGWTLLGQTQGFKRCRQDYYVAHERPKQLWVRELQPGARTILRGAHLPAALKALDDAHPPICNASAEEFVEMRQFFSGLPEFRKRLGCYKLGSLVAATVCAALCGVHRGQRDIAAFVADMTPAQWAGLGFPRRGRPRRFCVPKETTFQRLLHGLQPQALEKALLDWQNHVLGPPGDGDDLVAVDGKELLHSGGLEIVSAYRVKSGRWAGSEAVAKDSNEIPAAQELLRRAPIEGSLVLADALHTQLETGRIITQERGADFLFTVKGNQPTVADSVRGLHEGLAHAFPPSP